MHEEPCNVDVAKKPLLLLLLLLYIFLYYNLLDKEKTYTKVKSSLLQTQFEIQKLCYDSAHGKNSCKVYQGFHFVRNVRNCQEFEKFCQKVRKMSGKLLIFSNVRKMSGIFYDILSGNFPYFMFFCSV